MAIALQVILYKILNIYTETKVIFLFLK